MVEHKNTPEGIYIPVLLFLNLNMARAIPTNTRAIQLVLLISFGMSTCIFRANVIPSTLQEVFSY